MFEVLNQGHFERKGEPSGYAAPLDEDKLIEERRARRRAIEAKHKTSALAAGTDPESCEFTIPYENLLSCQVQFQFTSALVFDPVPFSNIVQSFQMC